MTPRKDFFVLTIASPWGLLAFGVALFAAAQGGTGDRPGWRVLP